MDPDEEAYWRKKKEQEEKLELEERKYKERLERVREFKARPQALKYQEYTSTKERVKKHLGSFAGFLKREIEKERGKHKGIKSLKSPLSRRDIVKAYYKAKPYIEGRKKVGLKNIYHVAPNPIKKKKVSKAEYRRLLKLLKKARKKKAGYNGYEQRPTERKRKKSAGSNTLWDADWGMPKF